MNRILNVKYIKEEYKDNLRNYKYKGGDNSILYKIFINPFCNWAVEYLPMWLAPNVITVSGFFLNVTYILITTYYTGLKGADYIPPWACYFCAFAYSLYIILDNMDGKQARRTKASSPLGLLVDHGTDACTTFFITIGLGSFLFFSKIIYINSLADIKHYTLLWIMINFPFFLNTWEEYYIGELFLPIVHGVSEGTVLIATVMSLSGKYGIEFWHKEVNVLGYSFYYNTFCAILGFIGGQFFGYISLINVCIKCKDRWISALKDCFIYLLLVGSYLIMIFWADSVIIKEYPKLLIFMFGFPFAKLMGHLQLSHLQGSIFKPYRKSFMASFIFCVIHTLASRFLHITLIASIDYFIIIFLIIHFITWVHWVYFVSDELCDVLNIKRFSLGPRYSDTKKAQ